MAIARLHAHPGDPGMGQPMGGSRTGLGGVPRRAALTFTAPLPAPPVPAPREPAPRTDTADLDRLDTDHDRAIAAGPCASTLALCDPRARPMSGRASTRGEP